MFGGVCGSEVSVIGVMERKRGGTKTKKKWAEQGG